MDLFAFDPPDVTPDDAAAIAAEHWRVAGPIRQLRGERSANFHIGTPGGPGHVLQVQSASERTESIELQTAALRHVVANDPDLPVPRVLPTLTGEPLAVVELAGRRHRTRLVTFIPGDAHDLDEPRSPRAHREIGRLVGRVSAALADFDHPAAGHFMPWDLANGLVVDPTLRTALDPRSDGALRAVDDRLAAAVSLLPALRTAVVHNDGHAGNLLRPPEGSDVPAGLIDFGDVVRTAIAADVAIVVESFAPDTPDPIGVAADICVGYHLARPLDDVDLAAVGELVLTRAALTVLFTEYQIREVPHLADEARRALPHVIERLGRWARLDPDEVRDRILRTVHETRPA